MKKLILFTALIMLAGSAVQAQVGPEMHHIKAGDGLEIVSDSEGNYFKLQITGEGVSRLKTTKKYWYTADGVRFVFFSEENSNFLMTDLPRRLEDDVILQLYRSEFLRRQASDRPKLRSEWIKLANGKRALLWSYINRPASPKPITQQQFFITIAGPTHVYGLFAMVAGSNSPAAVRRVLVRTLGSLTFSDEPFAVLRKRCDSLARTPCR
jgi:hypothetical protein